MAQRDEGARRIDHGAAALWASAMVILAMIVVQAGRLGGSPALARDVDDAGAIRLLTATTGNTEDFIAIVNGRAETLGVYAIQNGRSVELLDVQRLPELFEQAARASGAGPRR